MHRIHGGAALEHREASGSGDPRAAIITGSTSGIGLSIAYALAGVGCNVVLNGFGDPDEIEHIRIDIERAFKNRAKFVAADVSDPGQIGHLVEQTEDVFGQVDILVNNAGIQHVEAIETFPAEKWDAIIAVNLSAAFHATRAVIGGMKQRGWGRIINVASAHGLVASPFKSAYVASKHGMVGLTKTVALEAAEYGVTVNALCPGYVLTPLVEKQIPETAAARGISEASVVRDVILSAQPTRKFISDEEIGAVCAFLCSDAARSITGAAVPIDGGWTAQ